MLKVIDLYSGIGGLTLGFEKAGFEVVGAIDNWEFAVNLYNKNFNHEAIQLDLSKSYLKALKYIKERNPDMVVGGPPCQDFSSAGKRDENLGRGSLTITFANIIKDIRPEYFLMENVERINKTDKYKQTLKLFKECGYGVTEKVFDASLCGVPQKRKRYIAIGALGEKDGFLNTIIERNLSKKSMTIRDYLGDSLGIDHYYRHPRNYNRRAVFSVDEPSPTVRGVNRPIPNGYPGHKGDTSSDLSKIRPLTTKERSLIQTFPMSFILEGSKTNLEQAVGNAVPVNLAKFVADAIKEFELLKLGSKGLKSLSLKEPSLSV